MDEGSRLAEQSRWLELLLSHLAGRTVLRHVEREDLVQEVFLRVLHLDSVPTREEGEAALRRYLARVARHTVTDVARALRAAKRSGRVRRLARSDWSVEGVRTESIADKTRGPATRAMQGEAREDLQQAFESLPANYRRVIGLRQLEGLSAHDAARRLGSSETAVHSLYRRALQAWGEAASK